LNAKKVFFVCYGGGHAKLLKPVILELLSVGCGEVVVLALTSAPREFLSITNKRFDVVGFKDFFGSDRDVMLGKELASSLSNVIDLDETIAYLGRNYGELIDTIGFEAASLKYKKEQRQAFLPVESLKYIINIINPSVVVTTNSPRSEKAALIAAYHLNIPSIAVVDMFAVRSFSWLVQYPSQVCVLSDSVKEYLVKKGRLGSTIHVTGNPSFDSLVKTFNKKEKEIQSLRCGGKFTVLWASQQEPEYVGDLAEYGNVGLPINVENALQSIFKDKPDWQLVVRNHPNELPRNYPSFVQVSLPSESLEELLVTVDVVVTLTSTVGFQGLIMGCYLVTVAGSVFTPTMPFGEMGFSNHLASSGELEVMLDQLYEKKFNEIVNEPNYPVYDATERVVGVISKYLNTL
jgi:hypothetical protein